MTKKKLAAFAAILCLATSAHSFDPLRNPEIAGKGSLFIDIGPSPLPFADPGSFVGLPLEFRADWLLPFGPPLSVGAFLVTPFPNLKHFGTRLAWHVDLDAPKLDLYLLYVFDFGFLRNETLEAYNDTPVPLRMFDFRIGVRRVFGDFLGLGVETAYHLRGLHFLLSMKFK